MLSQDLLYRIFTSRHRWLAVLATLVLCAALALAVGYLLAEFGVLVAGAGLVALFLGLWMLRDIEAAYWAVIGVVCLLPFASFPFDIGFTPTFLDAALGALFLVWVLEIATGGQREFVGTQLGLPIVVFMLLAVGSFIFGAAHAPLTSYILRHFAEVLLSVALFFLVVNTVRDAGRLRRSVRALLLCAFAASAIGVVLYVVADQFSEDLVIRALSALGRLGYPAGPGVLRYIREDPELPMRATSTSVDPNVLGSLLNLALCIGVPQLFARHTLIRRRYLVPMLGVMALCLGLTISRGSLVGVGAALVVVATLRYRKLWLLLLVALALLLVLPQTQDLVTHFVAGLRGEDLATQMRFGEYKDAFILIGRYPWLGVGFAGSPDIDTYIGVSNVYLLIAEQMGLVGLASFLVVMIVFFARFWRTRALAATSDSPESKVLELEPLWWGLHTGIIGALVGGIFDHYFFNLSFPHSVTLFWFVVGLATAATEMIRGGEQPAASPGGP
ncbi:MAG: O-antigen ligase family protein [Chloroflexota bacterium]|nr:O-antigen ligase family protein [Chloroflexota bacterium]